MLKKQCVSVIVPIYNQEKYLPKSIPALLSQTYGELDVVLVNDGSTDASLEMIRRYAACDARIQIVNKENGGLVDATLAGIHAAKGEYLCFLDPDDLAGPDFVRNFMDHMTDDIDFVSTGFYYDRQGVLEPYHLLENRQYSESELREYREKYLFESGIQGISNRFFISRWNKLLRTELALRVAEHFVSCRGVSLGEDSLFVFLMLCLAKGGRTVQAPNSYFYNVENPNSMMKAGQIEAALKKSEAALRAHLSFSQQFGAGTEQAYALYYFLVNSVIAKALAADKKQFRNLCKLLKRDDAYGRGQRLVNGGALGRLKGRLLLTPTLYFMMQGTKRLLRKCYHTVKTIKNHTVFWCKRCMRRGPIRAFRLLKHQKMREHAFQDMNRLLPKLETRIVAIIEPLLAQKTSLSECPVEKNIFVFWWDGFDRAPALVQGCLASIKRHHPQHNIILIDQNNFQLYTDISPAIIEARKADKISVQTFSDILRFNLLKNNGGTWVDATLFFTGEFDLQKGLADKSFESLAFSTSNTFLRYGDEACSWSGYFIASRKNGALVQTMDAIFREYYLRYHTYSAYFFIDMAFMICKKYGVDDRVLDLTQHTDKSMFALSALIDQPYQAMAIRFMENVPQKLSWNVGAAEKGSFHEWILSQQEV